MTLGYNIVRLDEGQRRLTIDVQPDDTGQILGLSLVGAECLHITLAGAPIPLDLMSSLHLRYRGEAKSIAEITSEISANVRSVLQEDESGGHHV